MFRSLLVVALLGFCLCDNLKDIRANIRKNLGPEEIEALNSLNDADDEAILKIVTEHRAELTSRAAILKLLGEVNNETQTKYAKIYAFVDEKFASLKNKEAQVYAEFVFQAIVDIHAEHISKKADVAALQEKADEVVKKQAALSSDAKKAIETQFPVLSGVISKNVFKAVVLEFISNKKRFRF